MFSWENIPQLNENDFSKEIPHKKKYAIKNSSQNFQISKFSRSNLSSTGHFAESALEMRLFSGDGGGWYAP